MCAALPCLEHRSCGDTQPPTLPEYGDRKTVTPLTVEREYVYKKERQDRKRGKGRDLNGRREWSPSYLFQVHARYGRNLYKTIVKYMRVVYILPLHPAGRKYIYFIGDLI